MTHSIAPQCARDAGQLDHQVGERRQVQQASDGEDNDGEDSDLTSLVRRWVAIRKADRPSSSLPSRMASRPHPAPEMIKPGDGLDGSSYPEVHNVSAIETEPNAPADRRREGSLRRDTPRRLAVLIDAQTTPPDAASDLFELLAAYGTIGVCRGYADWTRAEVSEWFIQWRRHGIQPVHHFAVDEHVQDEQALLALSIDAVDIARDAAVDVVVIVGDLRSTVPLVNRLHALGLEVLAVGPSSTPHYVRAAYDEFIDLSTLTERPSISAGRHRA